MVCMYVAVYIAGDDAEDDLEKDSALERLRIIIAAYQFVRVTWPSYRNENILIIGGMQVCEAAHPGGCHSAIRPGAARMINVLM